MADNNMSASGTTMRPNADIVRFCVAAKEMRPYRSSISGAYYRQRDAGEVVPAVLEEAHRCFSNLYQRIDKCFNPENDGEVIPSAKQLESIAVDAVESYRMVKKLGDYAKNAQSYDPCWTIIYSSTRQIERNSWLLTLVDCSIAIKELISDPTISFQKIYRRSIYLFNHRNDTVRSTNHGVERNSTYTKYRKNL